MGGRFTSGQLKMLAMGTMFIDHAAVAIIYNTGLNEMSPLLGNIGTAMRLVGRMAFPLYAFLLVQGFLWTRSWKSYMARMLLLAFVSEIPFNLVAAGVIRNPHEQNTTMTLLIGLICMKILEMLEQKFQLTIDVSSPGQNENSYHRFSRKFLGIVLMVWAVVGSMLASELIHGDYGAAGVLLIVALYLFRHRPVEQVEIGCLVIVLIYGFRLDVLFAWIAFFFISRYNGERGRRLGLFPYVFYPAHLLVVWLAGVMIAMAG